VVLDGNAVSYSLQDDVQLDSGVTQLLVDRLALGPVSPDMTGHLSSAAPKNRPNFPMPCRCLMMPSGDALRTAPDHIMPDTAIWLPLPSKISAIIELTSNGSDIPPGRLFSTICKMLVRVTDRLEPATFSEPQSNARRR
jgi:hypothetical protein